MRRDSGEVVVCETCGMMYMANLEKDVATHQVAHDMAVHGVPIESGNQLTSLIRRRDDGVVWLMSHNIATQAEKKFAQKVCRTAKLATERNAGFSWWGYHPDMPVSKMNYRIYLYQAGDRIVGMAAMGEQDGAWLRSWGDEFAERVTQRRTCIDMVWVAQEWRRKGIAHSLLTIISEFMLTNAQSFAWSSPFSKEGAALVKHFCPVRYFSR